MNIVVLAGGLSSERNVSLATGACVSRALRAAGHRTALVDMFLGLGEYGGNVMELFSAESGENPAISPDAPDLDAVRSSRQGRADGMFGPRVLEICARADIVFLGLHGACGEDGRVQAAFDLLGIPYTGAGYLGSGMAMNKATAKLVMERAGVLTAPWREVHYAPSDVERLAGELPVPCAVKAIDGGSSLGLALPSSRGELKTALETLTAYGGHILVEKRLYGRDFSVGVLGGRALPAVEIIPQTGGYFDYKAKYQPGGSIEVCPAQITEEQQRAMGGAALKLHRGLGLTVYSRSDFILDENGQAWCLEINTLPGLTEASLLPKEAAAAGMSYVELCQEIVELSLKERSKKWSL